MGDFPGFLDFTKPGRGYIDDNRYHPFIRFWRRYGRHLTRLLCANALYALITMPVFVWLMSLINAAAMDMGIGAISVMGTVMLSIVIDWPGPVLAALLIVSILLMGPATAALSYAALNCAWDRPGMFWAGFWSAWKENWKQALPVGLVDVLVCFGTLYYLVDANAVFGQFGTAMKLIWCFFMLLYGMIRVYIYPVMVTVELSLPALVKNSMILSILKLWRPLVVMLIAAFLCLLCVVADLVIVPLFLYSFVAFSAAFFTQPVIEKYLIQAQQNA